MKNEENLSCPRGQEKNFQFLIKGFALVEPLFQLTTGRKKFNYGNQKEQQLCHKPVRS